MGFMKKSVVIVLLYLVFLIFFSFSVNLNFVLGAPNWCPSNVFNWSKLQNSNVCDYGVDLTTVSFNSNNVNHQKTANCLVALSDSSYFVSGNCTSVNQAINGAHTFLVGGKLINVSVGALARGYLSSSINSNCILPDGNKIISTGSSYAKTRPDNWILNITSASGSTKKGFKWNTGYKTTFYYTTSHALEQDESCLSGFPITITTCTPIMYSYNITRFYNLVCPSSYNGVQPPTTDLPPTLNASKTIFPTLIFNNSQATITLSLYGEGDSANDRKNLDVMLVLDNSGSMDESNSEGTKLQYAKYASKLFIDQLNSTYDRAGLVSFNTTAKLQQTLTSSFEGLKDKIDALTAAGSTAMGDGISNATAQLTSNNLKVEILLSDGQANLPINETFASAFALQKANYAATRNITIYTIGLGGDADEATLSAIADVTGGKYYSSPNVTYLGNIFLEIAYEVNNLLATNIFLYDVLPVGVEPSAMPIGCTYTPSQRTVKCTNSRMNLDDIETYSFNVTVTDTSLTRLNVLTKINYTDYKGIFKEITLIQPIVNVTLRCSNVCSLGQKTCSGSGFKNCVFDSVNGCYEWNSTITNCPSGLTCGGVGECYNLGLNVIPVIDKPNINTIASKTIDFSIFSSSVVNCSLGSCAFGQSCTVFGGLNCSYIHMPNTKTTSGYELWVSWNITRDDGMDYPISVGEWESNFGSVVNFTRYFNAFNSYSANVNLRYLNLLTGATKNATSAMVYFDTINNWSCANNLTSAWWVNPNPFLANLSANNACSFYAEEAGTTCCPTNNNICRPDNTCRGTASFCSELNESRQVCENASSSIAEASMLRDTGSNSICTFNEPNGGCTNYYSCVCRWNETIGCSSSYKIMEDCGGVLTTKGTCLLSTTVRDNCNTTEDNIFVSIIATKINYTTLDSATYNSTFANCNSGTRSYACSSTAKLPFFGTFELVMAVIVICLIYLLCRRYCKVKLTRNLNKKHL
jgi:uncharacterized protein YegL